MDRHPIADVLPDDWKARMIAEPYPLLIEGRPRSVGLRCPLGVAAQVCAGYVGGAPNTATVMALLWGPTRPLGESDGFDHAWDAVNQFIADWDAGYVSPADLPAALGVEPPPKRRRAKRP